MARYREQLLQEIQEQLYQEGLRNSDMQETDSNARLILQGMLVSNQLNDTNLKKMTQMEKLNMIELLADSLISTDLEAQLATEIINLISKKMFTYKVMNLPESVQTALSKSLDSGDINQIQNLQIQLSHPESTNMNSGSYSTSNELSNLAGGSSGITTVGGSQRNISGVTSGSHVMQWAGNQGRSSDVHLSSGTSGSQSYWDRNQGRESDSLQMSKMPSVTSVSQMNQWSGNYGRKSDDLNISSRMSDSQTSRWGRNQSRSSDSVWESRGGGGSSSGGGGGSGSYSGTSFSSSMQTFDYSNRNLQSNLSSNTTDNYRMGSYSSQYRY